MLEQRAATPQRLVVRMRRDGDNAQGPSALQSRLPTPAEPSVANEIGPTTVHRLSASSTNGSVSRHRSCRHTGRALEAAQGQLVGPPRGVGFHARWSLPAAKKAEPLELCTTARPPCPILDAALQHDRHLRGNTYQHLCPYAVRLPHSAARVGARSRHSPESAGLAPSERTPSPVFDHPPNLLPRTSGSRQHAPSPLRFHEPSVGRVGDVLSHRSVCRLVRWAVNDEFVARRRGHPALLA